VDLLLPYKDHVHSITTDNGMEFAKHEYIAKRLTTSVYFADPYSSWQKGAIENMNKLIRQYLPKKLTLRFIPMNKFMNFKKN
jgi:IS30 family transposase